MSDQKACTEKDAEKRRKCIFWNDLNAKEYTILRPFLGQRLKVKVCRLKNEQKGGSQ